MARYGVLVLDTASDAQSLFELEASSDRIAISRLPAVDPGLEIELWQRERLVAIVTAESQTIANTTMLEPLQKWVGG
jgi:hypothetical protein